MTGAPALALEDATAAYGKAGVLHGVSLFVEAGEIVSVIGRNGAGKTTTLRAMAGLMPLTGGRLLRAGEDVTGLGAHRLSRRRVNYVPDTRRIFPNLSVEENLRVATYAHPKRPWTVERAYRTFPRLAERAGSPGDALSGGEQQMLAIARGLLTGPEVILLDEPTEGLAPRIVDDLVEAMREIRRDGIAIVLVEQKLKVPMALASRQYVIENGAVVWSGTTAELAANRREVEGLIGF